MPRTPSSSESVVKDLRRQIDDGTYASGDRLPSIRRLVAHYGVSKNAVVNAYERLIAYGNVESRRGSGYYVVQGSPSAVAVQEPTSVDRALDSIWMMREQLNNDPLHLPVGHGIPPGHWLSDTQLGKAQLRVSRVMSDAMFKYGSPYGYRPLRDLLERKLDGLSVQARANQIVLTFGANEALDIVVRCLLKPGDVALVDEPGYYPLYGKLRLHGVDVVGVAREADGPDIAMFEQLVAATAAKVFFTQSAGQNPTGSDTSPAKAFRLLQVAEKYGVTIVENDSVADLKPTSSARITSLDQLRRTVYIGSFTKSVAAALRVGFIAAEAGLAERLADIKMLMHVSTSEYAERTVDTVLRAPDYQRHLVKLHQQVERATRHAAKILTGLGAQLLCTPSHSLYLWARFPWAPDSLELAKRLLADNIALAPGALFSVDTRKSSAWSRYNVGYVGDARFAAAMLRLRPQRDAASASP